MVLPWVRKRLLADPKRLGRWGQNRSQKYLTGKGCKLLARNYAASGGELDLVMTDVNGAIVFVEVKTRRDEAFARARDAVDNTKRDKMIRTAKRFLREFKISDRPLRFDVITVILGDRGKPVIQHYPNAFTP
jgi:putative endonuclease